MTYIVGRATDIRGEQALADAARRSGLRPFVKWAGGKRQLLSVLDGYMPESFDRYFEPFVGGGALFFHVASTRPDCRCHISDLNKDLVMLYEVIRDKVDDLIRALRGHNVQYQKDPERYYYHVRERYNLKRAGSVQAASRLIFLNKTCFNGLYRVNSGGDFNVPFGKYKNPNIADEENIRAIGRVLNSPGVEIKCQDFGEVARQARRGDFVYFDPPYLPVSTTSSFTQYTRGDFGLDDQRRLARLCIELDEMGCRVMLSNSDSGAISEMFSGGRWRVQRVKANRSINSVASKRTGHAELLITNY